MLYMLLKKKDLSDCLAYNKYAHLKVLPKSITSS